MTDKDKQIVKIGDIPAAVWVSDPRETKRVPAWLQSWRRQKHVKLLEEITFDATTTIKTSESIFCAPYSILQLFIDLKVTAAPTDITIELQFSPDNARFYKHMDGPFGSLMYEDSAGNKMECLHHPVTAEYLRVKATATGTDGSNKFTLSLDVTLSG